MSKNKYDKVEIVLPNTNIKAKFTPAVWNIKADKEGFVTIENIKEHFDDSFSEFDEVYFGDEITNTIGKKNVVIVVNTFKPEGTDEIEDTLIYGLELGSFRCVTPIWSRLQQRTIPLYTKEYIEAYKRIHRLYGAKQDDITIFFEVIGTMNNLVDYYLPSIMSNKDIQKKSPVAGEDYDISSLVDDTVVNEKGELNKEFIKRFNQ